MSESELAGSSLESDDPATPEPEAEPLLAPRDGVPGVSSSRHEIARAAELLASGTGPFAVDAERASGFRYSNRAYLVQIRRAGAGTVLIDPVSHGGDSIEVLAPVAEVLADMSAAVGEAAEHAMSTAVAVAEMERQAAVVKELAAQADLPHISPHLPGSP